MIFSKFSKNISKNIIKDIKDEIPKVKDVCFRKEKKGYFFYNKEDMKTGKIGKLGYLIFKNIDNKASCEEILERINKNSKIPLVFLSDLFVTYLKSFQELGLVSLSKEINKKINPKILKEQNNPEFLSAPTQIAVLLTNECNLRCSHCGNENREKKGNELTQEEWFKIIDECSEMGVFVFNASGGEPFVRKDWYEILNYARKKGIEIGITSNGTLINERIALKLKKLDIFIIHLSLDGIGKSHDSFRNQKGVFEKVVKTIRLLEKHKIPFGVTSAISKRNFENVDKLKEFIKKNKIASWEIYYAIPLGCMPKEEVLSNEQIDDLARKINGYKKELKNTKIFVGDNLGYHDKYNTQDGWKGCQAGLSICSIDSEGNVKGCPIHPTSLIQESIREKSFSDIWRDKDNFSYNRKPLRLKAHCKNCKYGKTCRAGCKASMYSQDVKDFSCNYLCLKHIQGG